MKSIILLASLTLCSLQVSATVCNGGFEDGMSCWDGLTETFGFAEVVSSYTDGVGTTFTPTEGTYFLNFWSNEDRAQSLSWSKGDQISFDVAITEGVLSANAGLFFGVFDGLEAIEEPSFNSSVVLGLSGFETMTYTFMQDSPRFGQIVFQAFGTDATTAGGTAQDVGHVLLDNIQISAVPLPAAVSMFTPALVGLLFGFRRKISS